ncbi:iron transporter [Sphingomonas morindae]|uniref:Iron transporter n=1 Tax=Sphingomonas morindae TaxID=1541170 RepID=A0ABY4X5B0_9SPHN|nr:iron transporter [Sphingomonas morindae]USI72066.1 iron transporter [Sphingomonas morindae]
MTGRIAGGTTAKAEMALRWFTAVAGGYAAASGLAALAARVAPLPRAEAVIWAMLLAFPLYAGLLLWVLGSAKPRRAMAAIWTLALVAGGGAWLLGVRP